MFRLIFLSALVRQSTSNQYQWSYDADVFGGPDFWGLVEKDWWMCKKGRLQSPIDIQPSRIVFDPSIRPVRVDKYPVMSEIVNTGQMLRVRIGNSAKRPSVNITSGPFYGYKYRIQRVDIHTGKDDKNGSEHTIDGKRFPIEIQLVAYNVDLYANFSSASRSPHGLAIVSVLVDFGSETNEELLKLTIASASIPYRDDRIQLADFEPWRLLPFTRDIITYDGSMTSPACHETVTWVIVNQPIHITKDHFNEWAKVYTGSESEEKTSIAPNYRRIQESSNRLVRTNIQLKTKYECKASMNKMKYKANHVTPRKIV